MLHYVSLTVSTKKFGDLGMTFQLILVVHCGNAEPVLTQPVTGNSGAFEAVLFIQKNLDFHSVDLWMYYFLRFSIASLYIGISSKRSVFSGGNIA